MAMKTEPFGQNIADAINQMSVDAVKIAGITNRTIVNDSAYGFIRSLMAFGKTEQLGTPTPTEPKVLKSWNGVITSRKMPSQEAIDLGVELYGIPVDEGGNYTDADGHQWMCDKLDPKNGAIERNIKREIVNSASGTWTASSTFIGSYQIRNWASDRGVVNSIKHIQNRFVTQASSTVYSVGGCLFTGNLNVFPGTALCPNLDSFKSWVDANEIEVIYAMPNPEYEWLTQEQKNKLLQIRTYEGGTIFDFGGATPFFEIGYWLGNQNGQALADMDAKINQLLIK